MNSFERRINLDVPLEELSEIVCRQYTLGEFIENQLIEVGYEDYNYILTTTSGKYVVKVFSTFRTLQECKVLSDKATIPSKQGFSSPKIYKVNGDNLFQIKIKNTNYRLIVMEYVNGKDFLSLGLHPNTKEIKEIAVELAKLNKIQFKPPLIYDPWSIIDFPKEYKKHKGILSIDENKKIYETVQELKLCDFSKLKYGFVHGDLWRANIMKDIKGKLYYIDFSASNYLPRIVDIAISIGDICLDIADIENSKARVKIFLQAYESVSKLTEYEKQCLKTFIKVHQAASILNALREKIIEGNNSVANQTSLEESRKSLEIVSTVNLVDF